MTYRVGWCKRIMHYAKILECVLCIVDCPIYDMKLNFSEIEMIYRVLEFKDIYI